MGPFFAIIMAVLVAATPGFGSGWVENSCPDHPCCCHEPAAPMSVPMEPMTGMDHGCCSPDNPKPCNLVADLIPDTAQAAVTASRTKPSPSPATFGPTSVKALASPAAVLPPSTDGATARPGSPPTYLSLMTFLC